jgi:hypothetical protein
MSLPPIDPTGAMASGAYVDYMIGYNNAAADYLIEEMTHYVTSSTMGEWNAKWGRILGDVSSEVAALESSVSKLINQARMVEDAISKK